MNQKTLVDILKQQTLSSPDKKILLTEVKNISYSDIDVFSDKIANFLKTVNVEAGAFAGIFSFNSPEFIIISFAVWKTGAAVTPINYSLKPEEIIYIVKTAKIKCLFLDERFLANPMLIKTLGLFVENIVIINSLTNSKVDIPEDKAKIFYYSDIIESSTTKFDAAIQSPDLPALCVFTSGTTGAPKGALLSHSNIISNIIGMTDVFKFQPTDIVVNVLPMFHIFSFNCAALLELCCGVPIFIIDKFTPKQTLQVIEKYKITILMAVPVMLKLLIIQQFKEKNNTDSLRTVVSGGAALDSETFEKFKETFNIFVHEGYGITETAPVCSFNPIEKPPVKNSIGKPLKNVKFRIIDENGKDCAIGEKGELLISGPNVMMGYFNDQFATDEVMIDGWYKSGDVAVKDENENYFIVDRIKDMIIVNGLNVYPAEIEKCINSFESIIDSAVVGGLDKRHGEKVIAFIVINKNIEFDKLKLLNYLKSQLASYKVPDKIIVIEELPKSAIGKILKKELRKKLENELCH